MTLNHHNSVRHFAPARRRKATGLRRLPAMVAWLATILVLWCQRERLRWELYRLTEMDDHILKDIGVTRYELLRTLEKSISR